jgi:hypothetical protein
MTIQRLLRPLSITIAAAALGVLGLLAAAPAASAAPQMSVTITDHVKTVKPGMSLTYTTTVQNMGPDPVDTKVVLTVPSYVKIEGARDGSVEKNAGTWTVTVEPHKTSRLQLTAKVGTIPESEVRVTTVASVYVDGVKPSPLIRTADANLIRGVADTPTPKPGTSSPAVQSPTIGWTIAIVIAAVLIVAAIITTVVRVRRRRSHPPLHQPRPQPGPSTTDSQRMSAGASSSEETPE